MTKTGAERAAKAALKNDAYVIMLRSKHNHFLTIRAFMKAAYQQFLFDQIVNRVSVQNGMLWGKKAQFMDLARNLVFHGLGTQEEWLSAGMPTEAFNQTNTEIEKASWLYYMCVYPRSMLITKITVTDNPNETPLTQEKDWLKNLTDLNVNELSPVSKLPFVVFSQTAEVCIHKCHEDKTLRLLEAAIAVHLLGIPIELNQDVGHLSAAFAVNDLLRETNTVLGSVIATPNLFNEKPQIIIRLVASP